MTTDDLCWLTLTDAAERIAAGALSPVELTQAVLARIERLDPALHAYLAVLPEPALAAARAAEAEIVAGRRRGPLHGIPVAAKDLCDLRGTATTCASRVLDDRIATADATCVTRLTDAGAVIVGKTNLTEFALMGYHPTRPIPINPWNAASSTGGSSSGSGVAVAAGLCFAALGTDTGGSIRIPSAWCGTVGLKPTYGRVSRAGVFPLGASLDHIGPMARSVADAAHVLDALAGLDPRDATTLRLPPPRCAAALGGDVRGVRIGWDEAYATTMVLPEVADAVYAAVDHLARLGAEIVRVRLPAVEEVVASLAGALRRRRAGRARALLSAAARRSTAPPSAPSSSMPPSSPPPTTPPTTSDASSGPARSRRRSRRATSSPARAPSCRRRPPTPSIPTANSATPSPRSCASRRRSTSAAARRCRSPAASPTTGCRRASSSSAAHGAEATLCRVGDVYERTTEWHRRRPPLAA